MNERHLKTIFSSEAFNLLWESAKVVTIAIEPYYCGFNEECLSILKQLNSFTIQKNGIHIKEKVIQEFGL